ncbi:MAG: hypothetical protein A4E60_02908 [Syntrophorhabdus sp. PtaB.Bin047]|nr:MAG: hypothetical protein A4E60_02908 [Syntrophorhabdus sp. PtaB.Bin047]
MIRKALDEALGVEGDHVVAHDGAADPRHDEGVEERVDVAAGHNEQNGVVEIKLVVVDHDEILGEQVGVALHDALGQTCRSTGVHDDPDVIGGHFDIRLRGARLRQHLLVVDEAVVAGAIDGKVDVVLNGLEVLLHAVDLFDPGKFLAVRRVLSALDDESLCFAVINDVFHLRCRKPEHKGHAKESALRGRAVEIHPFDAVVGENRKAVALLETEIGKGIRKPAGPLIPFFEGELLVKVFRPDLVGVLKCLNP